MNVTQEWDIELDRLTSWSVVVWFVIVCKLLVEPVYHALPIQIPLVIGVGMVARYQTVVHHALVKPVVEFPVPSSVRCNFDLGLLLLGQVTSWKRIRKSFAHCLLPLSVNEPLPDVRHCKQSLEFFIGHVFDLVQ